MLNGENAKTRAVIHVSLLRYLADVGHPYEEIPSHLYARFCTYFIQRVIHLLDVLMNHSVAAKQDLMSATNYLRDLAFQDVEHAVRNIRLYSANSLL